MLSKIPNYYKEPVTVTASEAVSRQKKASLFFIIVSVMFTIYFATESVLNWPKVEYSSEAASIPLPLVYGAENLEYKKAQFGHALVGYIETLWGSYVPTVSGEITQTGEKKGVWNSNKRASMPEIPLSLYLFKNDGNEPVEGFVHQSFSGPTRCANELLTKDELNMHVTQRPMVDTMTSTVDGSSKYKVIKQDGSSEIEVRDFPFASLVTNDFEVFTSYGTKSLTRVVAKLCGKTRSTDRPLYADFVKVMVPNDGQWSDGDTYQVDVAIDAPLSWGRENENENECGQSPNSACEGTMNRLAPSLEFLLKPGVTSIVSLRLNVVVDENGRPYEGGYALSIIGERERTGVSRTNEFDDMYAKADWGDHAGTLALTLELAEVNYIVTKKKGLALYLLTCLSELGGGLSIIASFCGVILAWRDRKARKAGKKKRAEDAFTSERIEDGQL
jgi:hypothetical protein